MSEHSYEIIEDPRGMVLADIAADRREARTRWLLETSPRAERERAEWLRRRDEARRAWEQEQE